MAEKDEQIKVLSRRINLEAKNFKVQLYAEQKKYKELCQQMEKQVAARTSRAMSDFYQVMNHSIIVFGFRNVFLYHLISRRHSNQIIDCPDRRVKIVDRTMEVAKVTEHTIRNRLK